VSVPAPPDPMVVLRDEIRQAGRNASGLRRNIVRGSLAWGTFVPFVLGVICEDLPFALGFGTLGLAIAAGVGIWAASQSRDFERQRVRCELRRLTREQAAAALLPLRTDPVGDTRKIVRPLLRELGVSTEMLPAWAPDGQGREVAGA
jgi:hypothetical protein